MLTLPPPPSHQLARDTGVVVSLHDFASGTGSDGQEWHALVLEYLDMTLHGALCCFVI